MKMDNLNLVTIDVNTKLDWDKVYQLPHYYIVRNSYHFLEVAAYAQQRPIGTLREEHGPGWYVLFKYSREIKYVDKYPEDFMDFTDKDWDELRNSLSPKDRVYYDLLVEEENKKEKRET